MKVYTINTPPSVPASPMPPDGSVNLPLSLNLLWSCADPEYDPLTFDVYFGTENPPPLAGTNLLAPLYSTGTLLNDTTYFWKIVARDDEGLATEGPVWNFSTLPESGWQCGNTLLDQRNGRTYITILIGSQCWMAENLNVGNMIIGSSNMSNDNILEKYCYDNVESNCDTYGGLYSWNEMMQYSFAEGIQGICPENWHLPTDQDWCTLEQFVDPTVDCSNTGLMGTNSGTQLKQGGNSGFEALYSGYASVGQFYGLGERGYYWTSSELGYRGWNRNIHYNFPQTFRDLDNKTSELSVRCYFSFENTSPEQPAQPIPPDNSSNRSLNNHLSWSCNDPEHDPLIFDIYFGNSNPPPLVVSNQAGMNFDTGILDYNMTYFWKIIAKDDSWNLTEGPVWSFTTMPDTIWQCGFQLDDPRDGAIYNTVLIGGQCWMAQNLKTGTMLTGGNASNNGIIEKYCNDNDTVRCDQYGGLYDWNEMMQYVTDPEASGICPPTGAWHIPSDGEWCTLERFLDPTVLCNYQGWSGTNIGTLLKQGGSSGFEAQMGGRWEYPYGTYGGYGYYWTSSQAMSQGIDRELKTTDTTVNRNFQDLSWKYSVRCVAYTGNNPPEQPGNPSPGNGSVNQSIYYNLSWSCYDPDHNPLTYDVYFGTSNPPGLVSNGQSSNEFDPGVLNPNTLYYWKIVAYDGNGNLTEGPVWSFTTMPADWHCGYQTYDNRNDRIYETVLINNQCWLAENLDIGTMITGTMTNNGIIEKFCYNDDPVNCDIHGGLYQWDEMMQYTSGPYSQGICPEDWKLPKEEDWCLLKQFVDPTVNCNVTGWTGTDVGTKLKQGGSSGFEALLGGYQMGWYNGSQYLDGYFWTSGSSSSTAFYRRFQNTNSKIYIDDADKASGYSVRCLFYPINTAPSQPGNPNPGNGAIGQSAWTDLSWTCSDPECDPLTYDVYFSLTNPPSLLISGLTSHAFDPGTLTYYATYYWKIVAHDNAGHSTEGAVWSFTTMPTSGWQCGYFLDDPRNEKTYPTVLIGTQCWMAKNLNIGTLVPASTTLTDNSILEKYCYSNIESNCDIYGGLYPWDEMMQYVTTAGAQGICPTGWHLPTDAQWCTLEQTVDPTITCSSTGWRGTDGGTKLKQGGSSGFEALLGGYKSGSSFNSLASYGYFWSSTQSSSNAWERGLRSTYSTIERNTKAKTYGYSVRCLKD